MKEPEKKPENELKRMLSDIFKKPEDAPKQETN